MTLVIRFAIAGYPLLLADMLLTAEWDPQRPLQLPSVRELKMRPDSTSKPIGLRQKLVVLSDDLMVGWAGRAKTAQDVVNDLIVEHRWSPFTPESISEYLQALNTRLSQKEEFALLGVLRDPARGFWLFNFRGYEFEHGQYGNIAMLGTGVQHAKEFLDTESHRLQYLNSENVADFGIWFALRTAGILLATEFGRQEVSLAKRFGAGYEVASFDRGFRKLDDVIHLLWFAFIENDTVTCRLLNVCKYKYIGEVLTVRIARLNLISENILELQIEPNLVVVQPIDRTIDEDFDSLPRPDFNSTWYCNNIFIRQPETDRVPVFTFVERAGASPPSIEFQEQGGVLVHRFLDQPHYDQIVENAYKRWSESGKP